MWRLAIALALVVLLAAKTCRPVMTVPALLDLSA
jgi:hypothetical protein